jgi:hypothetical protein
LLCAIGEDMGYTKHYEKTYGDLERRQRREEELERMTHEANLEDPNYYNKQNYTRNSSYDDFID